MIEGMHEGKISKEFLVEAGVDLLGFTVYEFNPSDIGWKSLRSHSYGPRTIAQGWPSQRKRERDQQMFQNKTFYQKTTTGKIMVWKIAQENSKLIYEWGYIDSNKWQKQEETISPINVATTAEQDGTAHASEVFDRKVKKHVDNGYFETQAEAEAQTLDINFDDMPKSFSPPKPIQAKPCEDPKDKEKANLPNKTIKKLIKEDRLWAQHKANGNRCYYIRSEKGSHFFSRKMKNVAENFPGLKAKFDALDIPEGTILDMEVTLGGGDTMEQYLACSSMSPNTKPERAQEIYDKWIKENPNEDFQCIVFDVIFWEGAPVIQGAYQDRYRILKTFIEGTEKDSKHWIVRPYNYTFDEGNKLMFEHGWEGLVLWDNEVNGCYTLNGKPKRLKGCYKWKLERFTDCFVTDFLPQDGNPDLVGSVEVSQYDDKGNVICRGRVGGGLTKETRKTAWGWKDQVLLIKFSECMKPNDKGEVCMQFPSIIEVRKDKTKDECIFDQDEQ